MEMCWVQTQQLPPACTELLLLRGPQSLRPAQGSWDIHLPLPGTGPGFVTPARPSQPPLGVLRQLVITRSIFLSPTISIFLILT